jgi:uncharacterized protein with PQ loop repeat
MLIADILLAIAGAIFAISTIPQIVKVCKDESAVQISWLFLISTWVAVLLFVIGKFLVGCYIASFVDCFGLLGYTLLICLKIAYTLFNEKQLSSKQNFNLLK